MIKRAKGFEHIKNNFYNPFEQIWFKSAFDLRNYRFWKYAFNKKMFISMW
jgi:hypothetical protein